MNIVLLLLLVLLPLVFALGGTEAFEPNKSALLLTGAIALGAVGLRRLLGIVAVRGWAFPGRALGSRAMDAARRDPLALGMLLFLASSALSVVASPRPALSLFGEWSRPAGLLVAAAMTALFFASRAAAREPGWFTRVAACATAAAGVASLYALVQLAGLDPISWEWTATFDGRARVPSTLGHPNVLGAYLAMTLPLSIALALRPSPAPAHAASAAVAAVSLAVIGATLSRGAWVGLAVGVAAAAIAFAAGARPAPTGAARERRSGTARPLRRAGAIAAASVLAIALLAAPLWTPLADGFKTRVSQIADLDAPTTRSRLLLWEAGARVLADHPVLGAGTDGFRDAFPRYRTPEFWRVEWAASPIKAHSEIVQIGATQGAVGLAAALWIAVGAGILILRLVRRGDPSERLPAVAAAGALAAWAVASATGYSVVATGSLAAVLAGWLSGRAARKDASAAPVPPHGGALAVSIAILLAVAVWIPLVLTPWRAATAASRALMLEESDPRRAAGLTLAHGIAPWEDDYAAEAGRSFLVQAFGSANVLDRLRRLGWARGGFERAARIAPDVAEHRAFLARTVAAQAARVGGRAVEVARTALAEAYRADSVSAGTLVIVEQGYIEAGMIDEGYGVARRCATLYPDFAVPMGDLGFVALHAGRVAGAADTLALALERHWRGVTSAEEAARENLRRARLALAAR